MQLTTQVIARNTKPNVVVLSSDPKGSEYVEWQPTGDPSGGDIQIVPESIAQSVPFIRQVQRGIFEIIQADENYNEAIRRQNAAFEKRMAHPTEQTQDVMDQQAKNDMITLRCVGPDGRGQGQCTNEVPVREISKNDKPPLCSQHEVLAPQYVPFEEQEGSATVKKWTRVTMTAPERQQQ